MDRPSLLRSAWTAPLVAALLLAGLYGVLRSVVSPLETYPLAPQGSLPAEFDRQTFPPQKLSAVPAAWLPSLLGSEAFTRLTSATTAEEGPVLNPPRGSNSESSPPSLAVRQPWRGARPPLAVPEPELLPDGTTGTGEPIPPRLSQRSGLPGPAPESALNLPRAAENAPGTPQTVESRPAPSEALAPGLLLPASDPTQRSHNLELIASEADAHTRHGFELAGRGACFSARTEFVTALRLLAQALDTEGQTNVHSQALATGLSALREADDFLPSGPKLEADLDLVGLVGRHRTPVLKAAAPSSLTPLTALQCYLTFAQEQLAAAAGREVAGSMALRGLGKLHETMAERRLQSVQVARPKAMAFYQAALLACPQNYLASNDLGVLLARHGRLEDARVALEHSLSIQQQPTVWHNLAVVYQQLGRADWAQRAQQRSLALGQAKPTSASGRTETPPRVQWLDPQTFSQTSPEVPGTPISNLPTRSPLGLQGRPTADARDANARDTHVAQSSSPLVPEQRK